VNRVCPPGMAWGVAPWYDLEVGSVGRLARAVGPARGVPGGHLLDHDAPGARDDRAEPAMPLHGRPYRDLPSHGAVGPRPEIASSGDEHAGVPRGRMTIWAKVNNHVSWVGCVAVNDRWLHLGETAG
jgi:hypothetical protein